MDADQPLGRLAAHGVGDGGPLVTALGDVAGVAELAHQLRPRLRDAADVPADLGRLGGEAVPGDGRQHEIERVLGPSAVRGRVGQRPDGLEQLDDRAGPAVRHDQRQRIRVRRLHVDEVHVLTVDLGLELRQRVQPRLASAPVVLGRPVAGELLQRSQLHALRAIGDQFLRGPARRGDAPPKVGDRFLRHVDPEGPDFGFAGHKSPPPGLVDDDGRPRTEVGTAPRSSFARARRARDIPGHYPGLRYGADGQAASGPQVFDAGRYRLGADHPERRRSRRLRAGQPETKKTAVRRSCHRCRCLAACWPR